MTFNYGGGYWSFESGDIDPGLTFGHGFLAPGSGDGARFDIWFAPDGVIDGTGIDGGGGASVGGNYAAGGDDVFMGAVVLNEDGVDQYLGGAGLDIDSFAFSTDLTNITGPGFADGTAAAYGRVFENDNPLGGDWYYVGAAEVIRNVEVIGTPPNAIAVGRAQGVGGLDPIDGTTWSFVLTAGAPTSPLIVKIDTDVTLWAVYTATGSVTPIYSTNPGAIPIEWIPIAVFSNALVNGTNVFEFDPPDTNASAVIFQLRQVN